MQARFCFDILSARVLISKYSCCLILLHHGFTSSSVHVISFQRSMFVLQLYILNMLAVSWFHLVWIHMLFVFHVFGRFECLPVPRCGLFPYWSQMWFVFRTAKTPTNPGSLRNSVTKNQVSLVSPWYSFKKTVNLSIFCAVIECSKIIILLLSISMCIHVILIWFIQYIYIFRYIHTPFISSISFLRYVFLLGLILCLLHTLSGGG